MIIQTNVQLKSLLLRLFKFNFRIDETDELTTLLGKPNLSDEDYIRLRNLTSVNPERLTVEQISKIFQKIEFRPSCVDSAKIALMILERFPSEKERMKNFITDNKTMLRRRLAKIYFFNFCFPFFRKQASWSRIRSLNRGPSSRQGHLWPGSLTTRFQFYQMALVNRSNLR